MILNTIGFSGKSAEEFFKILNQNSICRLIDIRLNNKSQLAGFTNIKHLPYFLKIHNITYDYKPEYAPAKDLLDGYKKKTIKWKEYETIYKEMLIKRNILVNIEWNIFENAVLLCSEPTSEKCHRRLLAEYLMKENKTLTVRHL
ncbi:DUF488 [Desulfonema limicola]|uniref:DUF488 n=1 Tax=Desulfonema limicola TaxID=45656 RepID=A0A975BDT8_9BACT|nr:DUF488 domain-containing protein [Desulfonema limicola]QTA83677.1 DUF488 [Desulfonema limicola]